jgi:hypothetical protein
VPTDYLIVGGAALFLLFVTAVVILTLLVGVCRGAPSPAPATRATAGTATAAVPCPAGVTLRGLIADHFRAEILANVDRDITARVEAFLDCKEGDPHGR